MDCAEKLFEKLIERVKIAAKFKYAADLLEWDQQTKMPNGGADGRAEIFAAVKTEGFRLFTSEKIGKVLKKLENEREKLDADKQALVQRIGAIYQRTKDIPPDLFKSFNIEKSRAYVLWVEARRKSNFKLFQPALEKIINFMRHFAEIHGYRKNPYDGLLPDYEPGLTTADLRKIFDDLRKSLVPFVHLLTEDSDKSSERILEGYFPVRLQRQLSLQILETIGYDFEMGRLDTTAHPFTTSVGPDDVRVTIHFVIKKLTPALFATIHEGGHALYEQGVNHLMKWLYLDTGYSHGLHESQSRMWENMVGRSLPFWKFFYPKLQVVFPRYQNITLEDFYRAINTVKLSPIRIYADEVTYNLHVLVRFEIEEALIKGELEVEDLPSIWKIKMGEYLGIVPKNDADGLLQDVHWSQGYFGYFPTYTLGNLYGAQLFAAAKRQIKNLEGEITRGNLSILLNWLRCRIHRFGLVREAPELLREVTGKSPTPKPWLDYIEEKFGKIYSLS